MQPDFPIFRLIALLVRQISSPIAARIKEYARSHPWFSRRVCMGVGRGYHVAEVRLRLWTLALRQPRAVPPLSDAAALDSGANLLGEAIIFLLCGSSVVYEVNRQANLQEEKILDQESQWVSVLMQTEELKREVLFQQKDIERLIGELRFIEQEGLRPSDGDEVGSDE